ncbi:MAG: RdgB/HAM1 family non-canonical purine NTP pyrophosphatase [Chloroflexi bacterium]|nr:RdgB/HAM1 family non-canonical purine NTP pyrophosphatase [Chloroflexota bacterium]
MKLLLATNNRGKIAEYQALLAGLPLEVTTPAQEGLVLEVEETGKTLEENAGLKARAFAQASGLLALADDSGLFVDALSGEPGVHTARYAGPDATDPMRVAYLLRRMEQVPSEERGATFRCVIAVAAPEGKVFHMRGERRGAIALEPRGKGGFGYDPVFLIPELHATLAELPPEAKNKVSHRGAAARKARRLLQRIAAREGAR